MDLLPKLLLWKYYQNFFEAKSAHNFCMLSICICQTCQIYCITFTFFLNLVLISRSFVLIIRCPVQLSRGQDARARLFSSYCPKKSRQHKLCNDMLLSKSAMCKRIQKEIACFLERKRLFQAGEQRLCDQVRMIQKKGQLPQLQLEEIRRLVESGENNIEAKIEEQNQTGDCTAYCTE